MNAREKQRARLLWDAFRLTTADWDKILAFQQGRCYICNRVKEKFHTDHNHKTGQVRGLLCSQCNRALGKVEDPRWQWTPECLRRAAFYLKHPPAIGALGRSVLGFPGKIGTKKYRKWVEKSRKNSNLL